MYGHAQVVSHGIPQQLQQVTQTSHMSICSLSVSTPHPTPHPLYRRQSLPADDDNWPRLLAFLLLFVLSLLSSSQAKLNRPFTTSMLQLDFGLFLSNRLISTTRGRVQSEAEKDGRRDGVYVASTRHGGPLIIYNLDQLI